MKGLGITRAATGLTRAVTAAGSPPATDASPSAAGSPAASAKPPTPVIDWMIAERIAAYVAGSGDDPIPDVDLEPLAADAAQRVIAYTRLAPARPLPPPEGVGRREWIAANLASMRRMLEPVLDHAVSRLGPLKGAKSLSLSLVSTVEIGIVVGFLAQRVLGQYELVMLDHPPAAGEQAPEPSPPRLLFVLPNLAAAVRTLDAPPDEFLTWVALHEVTHAVQFAGVPWLEQHMSGLISQLLSSMEVRLAASGRPRLPSGAELRRVGAAVRRGDIIGIFATEGERRTLDRVQATMAVIEGHAEHVMDAVAPDLLPSLPRLRAALDGRRRSQSARARLLTKLLGLEMKMRQYEQGKRFCDEIVRRAGTDALVTVFSSPEALPTIAELTDPGAWLKRVHLPASAGPASAA